MSGLGYMALGIAVIANFVANLALKRAMQQAGSGSLADILFALLASIWFWSGIISAVVLLGAYLFAIRTVPLGVSYATVTALTIALLTTWGFLLGSDSFSVIKIVGVTAIIAGLVLITVPLGSAE